MTQVSPSSPSHEAASQLPNLTTQEIGERFLDFFSEHGHLIQEGAGIVPVNDPTLLFINSGMAPMKRYFRSEQEPPAPRLANIQHCVRTTDIEDVGDSHHGTSFRMMGSWSFGDYFKEEAVDYAWQLVTEGFGIPAERLSATYLTEDQNTHPGVPTDIESAAAWRHHLPADRIIASPPEDNFWGPAGDTGPCGPCTEVFFDRGTSYGDRPSGTLLDGRDIEIWNAGVFMEFEKQANGLLTPLAMRSVDTGAGLERFAMILQNAPSIHQIDAFRPLFDKVEGMVGSERSGRIVFDHLKTSLMMLDSDIVPGNGQAPYVLRRLLRRSFTLLNLSGVSLNEVISLKDDYRDQIEPTPQRTVPESTVTQLMVDEIGRFEKILKRSEKFMAQIQARGTVSAAQVADMKSTHGIPEELVEEFCLSQGIVYPRDELAQLRAASKK